MKNYKSIRHFTEDMQQRQHEHPDPKGTPSRQVKDHPEKPEPELSFKKVIQFFKGIRP